MNPVSPAAPPPSRNSPAEIAAPVDAAFARGVPRDYVRQRSITARAAFVLRTVLRKASRWRTANRPDVLENRAKQ